MEGEHIIQHHMGLAQVVIDGISNLTLRGKRDHNKTDVVIWCSHNTHGLAFKNGNLLIISGINITGCGKGNISALSFTNIAILNIHHLIMLNNNFGHNLISNNLPDNSYSITINESMFLYNNSTYRLGTVHIYADIGTLNNITITKSTFANAAGNFKFGGGLYILCKSNTYNNVTITDSIFINNTINGDGGGLFLNFSSATYNNVNILHSTFTNNSISSDGGGLFIYSIGTCNNVTITNSAFSYNHVYVRGGAQIVFQKNMHYDIIKIINTTFIYNNVTYEGGGLYIYVDNFMTNNINIDSILASNNVGYIEDLEVVCY